jgi:hypothetical protein
VLRIRRFDGEGVAQPVEVRDVVFGASGRLDDDGRGRRPDNRNERLWVDGAATQRLMAVTSAAEGILRIVHVQQIDPPDHRAQSLDGAMQFFTCSVRMTGVEAETHGQPVQRFPQTAEAVKRARHRIIATCGVLDVHRNVAFELLQGLAPVAETLLWNGVIVGVPAMDDDRGRPTSDAASQVS